MTEEAFLRAVLGMRGRLYRAALTILWDEQDAADAIQEAMLKGWRQRDTLRDEAQVEGWFMRILINQCRDQQRRLFRNRRLIEESGRRAALEAPDPRSREVLEAVHELPEALRLPVLLFYFDGFPQAEIAEILGVSIPAVKNRLRQARERLKMDLMEGDDGDV